MPEYLKYLFRLSHVFLVSFKLDDAQNKSKKIPAKHPIIKSESENSFILGLMSYQKFLAWLDMKRKQGKMVTSAEPSDGSLYSSWNTHDPLSRFIMVRTVWDYLLPTGFLPLLQISTSFGLK